MPHLRAFLVGALLLLSANFCCAGEALRVGSKRFTESYILAQLLAQAAAPHAAVELKPGLGNTAIVYAALEAGSIDLYPEYLGTIAQEILKNSGPPGSLQQMNEQLKPLGLGVGIGFGFNDGYALAMRADVAKRLGIARLSDLARHPTLRLGLSNEFIGRADGWAGLARRYALPHKPTGLDHGLAYDAVTAGQVDLIDIYTTDAKIAHLGLTVLADDGGYFPRYDAVVLYRLDVPQRFPAAWAALQRLEGSIDEAAMIAMNGKAELQGIGFEAIAAERLGGAAGKPDQGSDGFLAKLFGPDLARLTWQHLTLVLTSVALAVLVGVPLAVAVAPHAGPRAFVLGASGLLQTVPSLAMLAALISLVERIGALPALLALTLYALLPIMRNCCAGLAEVPDGLKQAGTALGLRATQRLRYIELPLALPTIVAGVRTATSIAVGTATIAAFIGAGGYGERIVTGLALNDRQLLLAGALPSAALALAFEGLFGMLAWTMRKER
jgi:osmoprotectant transport system permease protein